MNTNLFQYTQLSLFDVDEPKVKLTFQCKSAELNVNVEHLTLQAYCDFVEKYGLQQIWEKICDFILENGETNFLQISNLGDLYETGLAIIDKQQKKEHGQYFTPYDVACVMSEWLKKQTSPVVCDVACGTGQLILSYLDIIGKEKARDLIFLGNLYLYDNDEIALNICKTIILAKYGIDLEDKINVICCDFLDKSVQLPKNCKVISNPPYSKYNTIPHNWENSEIQQNGKDYYSAFMEKILLQSNESVIITPYSFIGGSKFYSLRRLMNNFSGFIVSFDNVPGNIFYGRKHGIFNSNTSNSVRAAITVTNKEKEFGYKVSPLIRFKNEERKLMLDNKFLEKLIYTKRQIIDKNNSMYAKCDERLSHIYEKWYSYSNKILAHYICESGKYIISMPNTCRYYTSALNKKMNRNGQITIHLDNKDVFNFIYCLINSSFVYWFWRIFDGGITYPKGLLLKLPMFYDKISDEENLFFKEITEEMLSLSNTYIVTKNNVGVQENIKFPRIYRDKLNRKFLDILGIKDNEKIFNIVHSNNLTEICEK